MDEPTNAEVIALLREHMATSQALAREAAARSDDRERIASEHRGEMRAALKNMDGRIVELVKTQDEHAAALKELPAIAGKAREAMQSYDSLQHYVHGEIKDHIAEQIEKANKPVLAALQDQNNERDAIALRKAEERKQESLAAKAVADRRDFWVKMGAVVAPIAMAALGLIGVLYQSYSNSRAVEATQRAHDDTAARIETLAKRLSTPSMQTPAWGEGYPPEPAAPAPPASRR